MQRGNYLTTFKTFVILFLNGNVKKLDFVDKRHIVDISLEDENHTNKLCFHFYDFVAIHSRKEKGLVNFFPN